MGYLDLFLFGGFGGEQPFGYGGPVHTFDMRESRQEVYEEKPNNSPINLNNIPNININQPHNNTDQHDHNNINYLINTNGALLAHRFPKHTQKSFTMHKIVGTC